MLNNVIDYLLDIEKKSPEKIAYSDGEYGLTFAQVLDYSRRIGTYIHNKGLYGKPVIVFMDKHPNTITAFFGIIMSGNYYIPIDREMPEERVRLIIDNVKPELIITDSVNKEAANRLAYSSIVSLFPDLICTEPNAEILDSVYDKAIDTDPIYVVFTSGSTGVPKGVVACHRSVIDYIEQLTEVLGIDENTVFGNQTPLYVDACLKELYPTLKMGATTYLIPKKLFSMPVKLVEFINDNKINTLCWVVSALVMISAFNTFATVKPNYLRLIAFGSEPFPIKQFNIWKENVPGARFFNLYGPTEATGMSCYYEVERDFGMDEVIPIGKPFKNTQILLINDENRPAQDGECGEICIRGTALTMGYYNNAEKTAEAFIQNPFNCHYPELIYKTGDIGCYNDLGELVFVSRKDYQIKHHGYRIELGEIDAYVNKVESIKMSGTIYDKGKDKIILFYLGDIDEHELLISLQGQLPRYMMPGKIIKITEMPLTLNGKIDRNKLKDFYEKI